MHIAGRRAARSCRIDQSAAARVLQTAVAETESLSRRWSNDTSSDVHLSTLTCPWLVCRTRRFHRIALTRSSWPPWPGANLVVTRLNRRGLGD